MTVQERADDCGISVGSCDKILTEDLHMKRVCTKFVPRLLRDDQREQRQTIARDLFERSCEDVQFLKNTVTGILRGVLATFACINSRKTTGKMAGWRLDPAPRQCARTRFTSCAAAFGQTRHRSVAAAAILTRSRTV